jgi:hypothetical protein
MKHIKHLFLILVLFAQTTYATISLSIVPQKASLQDDIQLIFTYHGDRSYTVPDFSLLDTNFHILSTAKSTNVSVVNNRITSTTRWTVTVKAKRAGKLTVPSFSFGQDRSLATGIVVKEKSSASPSNAGSDVFMQATLDKNKAYVQAQLIYKIKLFYAKQLSSGNFSAPTVSNALLLELGKSKNYQTVIKGKTYRVSEQDYALFPEKSGKLVIKPPVFQGVIQRDNFSDINQLLMNVHKPIRVTADETKATILPIPSSYPSSSTWLPASKLSLSEAWEGLDSPKVGQPITRIITIHADGLTAEQLPSLTFDKIKGANVYPQKSPSKNRIDNDTVIGQKTIRVVYIPDATNTLTIPALSLPWWDLKNNKLSYASLKPKTLSILNTNAQGSANATSLTTTPTKKVLHKPFSSASPISSSIKANTILPWLISAILALSWLLFFIIKMRLKRNTQPSTYDDRKSAPRQSNTQITKLLKKACVESDTKKARHLLLSWARLNWPDKTFNALSDIKPYLIDSPLYQPIESLEKSIYAEQEIWQAHPLWVAWLKTNSGSEKAKKKSNKKSFSLPELNPNTK